MGRKGEGRRKGGRDRGREGDREGERVVSLVDVKLNDHMEGGGREGGKEGKRSLNIRKTLLSN